MKVCTLLLTFISWPLLAQVAEKDCANDYACFYAQKARVIKAQRQRQEEELQNYRNQQLELQRAQLEEMRRQNDLVEVELQEMNERQEKLEEKYQNLIDQKKDPAPSPAPTKKPVSPE